MVEQVNTNDREFLMWLRGTLFVSNWW